MAASDDNLRIQSAKFRGVAFNIFFNACNSTFIDIHIPFTKRFQQCRIQNPVKHPRMSVDVKIVDGF